MQLGYWNIAVNFLRLVEGSCALLVDSGNQSMVFSDGPMEPEEYAAATKWSDHSIGLPVLFNFFHGAELLLKGFLVAAGRNVKGHRLTKLLNDFEQSEGDTELGRSLAAVIRHIDSSSPLGLFLTTNNIGIDEWYEALKYPESMEGKPFQHHDLKYGGPETVEFWKNLGEQAKRLRTQAVALSRLRNYA